MGNTTQALPYIFQQIMQQRTFRYFLLPVFICISEFVVPNAAYAQSPAYNPVFEDADIPKITIQIEQAFLDEILAPGNEFSDEEFPATFIFSSDALQDTLTNVGFRLKGNTSRVSKKKSFKISFNTFEAGRKFHGLEKLNLNGEHNDPSIIRSKLSWDLFQSMQLPASRANHVALYVNDEFKGLYINVEHIDEQFLKSRFGNDAGNLYKCLYPADLAYLGPSGDDYKVTSGSRRTYDLKLRDTDDGAYEDLARLIDTINNTSDSDFANAIEAVFDVNEYLQILAIEIATGSWDGYWYLKNNYYLYFNPDTGLFHFIPFDYDNTLGIDFLGEDWATRNVYNWGHPTEARPLTSRLLNTSKYRDRFTYYMRQVLDEAFNPDALFPWIDNQLALILPTATADSFRTLDYGFDTDDFISSYTNALGNHVDYGLKPFITTRHEEALSQLDATTNVSPIIDEQSIQTSPVRPAPADPVAVYATIEDESAVLNVILEYRLDAGPWQTASFSQHQQPDGTAVYMATLPAFNTAGTMTYIISAQDESQQSSFTKPRHLEIGFPSVNLRINEFMASNASITSDDAGEFDDWVELYNADVNPISLEGKYLTDNLDLPDKWPLPAITLNPKGFLLLWLDNDEAQGSLHAPFKLSASGEALGLFGEDELSFFPIDTLSFSQQTTDISFARSVDGDGVFETTAEPTPGASNVTGGVYNEKNEALSVTRLMPPYPNPFNQQTVFLIELQETTHIQFEIFDALGRRVISLVNGSLPSGKHQINWQGKDQAGTEMTAGLYFAQLKSATSTHQIQKVVYLP